MKDSVVVDINKDLHWLEGANAIMNLPDGIEAFTPSDHLKDLHLLPASWRIYPKPPAYRLGRQFEDCIERLLQHSEHAQLLQRNLIIKGENRTLGELDCLYENTAGECVHLELAIKFYLFHSPFAGLEDFIGPGGKDRLDKKWQHLIQHQLPISSTPVALAAINNAGFSAPERRQLLLTGMLFYPYHYWETCLPAIKSLNPQHNRGWWLFQHQINQLECETEVAFILLPRWHWIGGLHHYDSFTSLRPLTLQELTDSVLQNTEPNMVAIIKWDVQRQRWEELNRGFIVRDDWPALRLESNSRGRKMQK